MMRLTSRLVRKRMRGENWPLCECYSSSFMAVHCALCGRDIFKSMRRFWYCLSIIFPILHSNYDYLLNFNSFFLDVPFFMKIALIDRIYLRKVQFFMKIALQDRILLRVPIFHENYFISFWKVQFSQYFYQSFFFVNIFLLCSLEVKFTDLSQI